MKSTPDVDAMYATLARLKGTTVDEERAKGQWYKERGERAEEAPRTPLNTLKGHERSAELMRRKAETMRMIAIKYGRNAA